MTTPNEDLIKAIREAQPEAMIRAIDAGANPYALETGTNDRETGQSALGLVIASNLVRYQVGGRSAFGLRVEKAIRHMLTVMPETANDHQEIINAHLACMGNEARAICRDEETEKMAIKMAKNGGKQISMAARAQLEIERVGPNKMQWILGESPAFKRSADKLFGGDLGTFGEAAKQAKARGAELGREDAQFNQYVVDAITPGYVEIKRDAEAWNEQLSKPASEKVPSFRFGVSMAEKLAEHIKAPENAPIFNGASAPMGALKPNS
jgi:hypothetical protein